MATPATGLVYDGTAKAGYVGTPSVSVEGLAGTLVYTYSSTDGADYSSTKAPVKAGSYKLTIAVPDNTPDYSGSTTIEFTIGKKQVTVSPKAVIITEGDEIPAIELGYTGLVGNDVITPEQTPVFECKDESGNAVDGTVARKYTIVWKNKAESIFIGADNYKAVTADGTLTVNEIAHVHTVVTDAAVAATCTTTGLTEGSHCSACNEVIIAQQTIAALGHDWSGEWKVVKEATVTEAGKRETYCTRGCGQKKVEVIPADGSTDEGDTAGGALQKDAEVAPEAPVKEATLNNKKSELLNAANIFTAEEKSAIENGKDARVWLEVNKTDENNIPAADKAEVKKAAEKIMGENPDITYFDADLFKQLEGYEKKQLHEPGIDTTVTIKIPDELLNHDRSMVREYKIIRLHYDVATGESNVEVLGGSFNAATGEFTFATDKFSTYAIAYNDIPAADIDIPIEGNDITHVTGIILSQGSVALTGVGETFVQNTGRFLTLFLLEPNKYTFLK